MSKRVTTPVRYSASRSRKRPLYSSDEDEDEGSNKRDEDEGSNKRCTYIQDDKYSSMLDLCIERKDILQELTLGTNQVNDDDLVAVAQTLNHHATKLWKLSVVSNAVGDRGIISLCEMLKGEHSGVRNLELQYCAIGVSGAHALSDLFKANKSTLQNFKMSDNQLGDEGMVLLMQGLLENTSIHFLSLCNCNTKDQGAEAIADVLLRNTKIEFLVLSRNDIGASGVKCMAQALLKNPSSRLQVLQLEQNPRIGNAGAKAMAELIKTNPPNLNRLDMGHSGIGLIGCNAIMEAIKYNHNMWFCRVISSRFVQVKSLVRDIVMKTTRLNFGLISYCFVDLCFESGHPSHIIHRRRETARNGMLGSCKKAKPV